MYIVTREEFERKVIEADKRGLFDNVMYGGNI